MRQLCILQDCMTECWCFSIKAFCGLSNTRTLRKFQNTSGKNSGFNQHKYLHDCHCNAPVSMAWCYTAFNQPISWRTTSCQLSVADYITHHSYLPHLKNVSSICNLRINYAVTTMGPHSTKINMSAIPQSSVIPARWQENLGTCADSYVKQQRQHCNPNKCHSCNAQLNSGVHIICISPTGDIWKKGLLLEILNFRWLGPILDPLTAFCSCDGPNILKPSYINDTFLPPYHLGIDLNKFSHPEAVASMFFRN